VGTGKIGVATARILEGIGCTVLGFDPYPSAEFETRPSTSSLSFVLSLV
jgi:D-lactate dehydrogenase